VVAPTHMPVSAKARKNKTDEKDALRILGVLRGHVLGGNELPEVWVPDPKTRDDREVVRTRLDAGAKATRVRNQIRMLLKRTEARKPEGLGRSWTLAYRAWLRGLIGSVTVLGPGARIRLGSLLRQLEAIEEEIKTLDRAVQDLALQERYCATATALNAEVGGWSF